MDEMDLKGHILPCEKHWLFDCDECGSQPKLVIPPPEPDGDPHEEYLLLLKDRGCDCPQCRGGH